MTKPLASTSSTTKLQGGYYIAPGVQSSTSSIFGKHEDVAASENNIDSPDERHTANPYVVMLSRPEVGPSEVIIFFIQHIMYIMDV